LETAIGCCSRLPGSETQLQALYKEQTLVRRKLENGSADEVGKEQPMYNIELLNIALKQAGEMGNNSQIIDIHGFLGLAYVAQEEFKLAIAHFKHGFEFSRKIGAKEQMWKSLFLISNTLINSIDLQDPRATLQEVKALSSQAILITRDIGDCHGEEIVQAQYELANYGLMEQETRSTVVMKQ
jgi:tetratricopeptide (TPR) repeat protein